MVIILYEAYLSSYPGYFREPHWLSMGFPEISRVTLTNCSSFPFQPAMRLPCACRRVAMSIYVWDVTTARWSMCTKRFTPKSIRTGAPTAATPNFKMATVLLWRRIQRNSSDLSAMGFLIAINTEIIHLVSSARPSMTRLDLYYGSSMNVYNVSNGKL